MRQSSAAADHQQVRRYRALAALSMLCLAFVMVGPAQAATITGITLSACTVTATGCNATGPELADTVGANSIPNAYLYLSGATPGFVNSGDTATSAALGLSLQSLGHNTANFEFQPVSALAGIGAVNNSAPSGYFEINLFLNGSTTTPDVSIFVSDPSLSLGGMPSPNSGTGYALSGALVPGAGTQSYQDGSTLWTFVTTPVQYGCEGGNGSVPIGTVCPTNGEMVGKFNNVADGIPNYSFSVTAFPTTPPVPLPPAVWLMFTGLAVLGLLLRARRHADIF